MRTWYVCLGCAAQYLPPESMTYPRLDLAASPVHCSVPACRVKATPLIEGFGVSAETIARWTRKAAGLDGRRRPARPARRARGGRAVSGPRSARSRLS